MSRLPPTLEAHISPQFSDAYQKAAANNSELTATYQSLFANPEIATRLADLDEIVGRSDLEPWVTYTVALTVAHERGSHPIWNAIEPLAREAGVDEAVINSIAAGTGPRGLLPKEGIWVHFALEVLRNQVRDSTWQAVTHLVGDSGAVSLAVTACYYEMMTRLNSAFGLDTG